MRKKKRNERKITAQVEARVKEQFQDPPEEEPKQEQPLSTEAILYKRINDEQEIPHTRITG